MTVLRAQSERGLGGRIVGGDVHILISQNRSNALCTPGNVDQLATAPNMTLTPTVNTNTARLAGTSGSSNLLFRASGRATAWGVAKNDVIAITNLSTAYPVLVGDVKAINISGAANDYVDLVNITGRYGEPITFTSGSAITSSASTGLSNERFPVSSQMPRETTSGIEIELSANTIDEKPSLQFESNVPRVQGSYDTYQTWTATVAGNLKDFGDTSDVIQKLLNIALYNKNIPVSLRMVTGDNFAGFYGIARPRPTGGFPGAVSETEIATYNMSFVGLEPLRVISGI